MRSYIFSLRLFRVAPMHSVKGLSRALLHAQRPTHAVISLAFSYRPSDLQNHNKVLIHNRIEGKGPYQYQVSFGNRLESESVYATGTFCGCE